MGRVEEYDGAFILELTSRFRPFPYMTPNGSDRPTTCGLHALLAVLIHPAGWVTTAPRS